MTAKLNRLTILTLIVAYFFLLTNNNVNCLPEIKSVDEPTKTNINPSGKFERILPDLSDEKSKRFNNYNNDHDDDKDDDKNKKKHLRKDRSDDRKKYSNKHDNNVDNNSDSDDDDHDDDNDDKRNRDKDERKSTPSNTIVTTIIIVATETPTTIYSGTANPAKQKGTGDENHQVHDPNSSSNENNDNQDPSETALTEQLYHDQSAYRKLVLALSIVGGLAGVALITGVLIYTRMRVRKRKRKQSELDLESAESSPTPSSPPPPPSHYTPPSPPPRARYSTMSDDGNSTIIDFNQNPFLDPSVTLVGNKNEPVFENRATILPNAPPTLPTHLYPDYRQNRTLSMISQTAGATVPSAPTAKELDATKHENPFEDEYGTNQGYDENDIQASPTSSPVARTRSPPRLLSQSSQQSYSSSDLPPPPAYTPNAAPSAPPLYALPTSRSLVEPQDDSLRRHSISSCSIASSSRPLSLRRGSGSLAHISSPFS